MKLLLLEKLKYSYKYLNLESSSIRFGSAVIEINGIINATPNTSRIATNIERKEIILKFFISFFVKTEKNFF